MQHVRPFGRVGRLCLMVSLWAGVAGLCASCDSGPEPRTRHTEPVTRDIPAILSNTIGSAASFNGTDPVLVFGYGIVVGLNGTGGGILDDRLSGQLEREMSLRDISGALKGRNYVIDGMSPRELLRDKNVGVVVVEAAIPPAAPKGLTFDVHLRAVNASSLEGGMLWSTDLFIQQGDPGTIGGLRGRRLAVGRGPIFINPFSDPARDADGISRRTGRVLDGGIVADPLKVEVLLDEPSHVRAMRITEAINTRFPEESGSKDKTARGRNAQSIALYVPQSFTNKPNEFIEIVKHIQIEAANPDGYARMYADGMKEQPWLANDLSLCILGVGGETATRFLRGLYDNPEVVPRMAALRAGARLGDHKTAEYLIRMAQQGAGAERLDAIDLLGTVEGGPTVDLGLRKLLESRELLVRVAAYETLAKRAQGVAARRAMLDFLTSARESSGDAADAVTHRAVLMQGAIPGNNMQGVRREVIADKFQLDVVPYGDPMIYITQQGKPKIVLFGAPMNLEKPTLVAAWDNRLMVTADSASDKHRVYYRDYRTGKTYRQEIDQSLEETIKFLARRPTPEDPTPGLNMTYSEVVGALYALHQQRGVICAFATESDKLLAQLYQAALAPASKNRPETPDDQEAMQLIEQPGASPPVVAPVGPTEITPAVPAEPRRPRIIPILRPNATTPKPPATRPAVEPKADPKPDPPAGAGERPE